MEVPFDAANFSELVTKITNSQPRKLTHNYSKPLRNLVSSMLAKDPQDRPTTDRVLRNEFVVEHIKSFAQRHEAHYSKWLLRIRGCSGFPPVRRRDSFPVTVCVPVCCVIVLMCKRLTAAA